MKSESLIRSVFVFMMVFMSFEAVCAKDKSESNAKTIPKDEPLILSLQDGIKLVLQNNLDITIEQQNPAISQADITIQKANFDPSLTLDVNIDRSIVAPFSNSLDATQGTDNAHVNYNAELTQKLLTGGNYDLNFTNQRLHTNITSNALINPGLINPSYTSVLLLTLTQPLLKNFGFEVNEAQIKIARNNYLISQELFEARVIDLILRTQEQYWDLVFARQNLKVQQQSLRSAQELLATNRERAEQGLLASIEVLVAEAGVASQQENIITAEKAIKDAEDNIRQLINLPDRSLMEEFAILPVDEPDTEEKTFDAKAVVRTAIEKRPDVRQAKVTIITNGINYRTAKNQLLPGLDFIGSIGLNGLGGSFPGDMEQLGSTDFYSWSAGLQLVYPLGNRSARASFARSHVVLDQSAFSLRSLEQNVILEVKEAVRRVQTDFRRIESNRKARVLAEKKVEAETERFNVGLSTTKNVLDFQRDLATAEGNELRAITDYNKSLANLEKVRGTSFEKNGIVFDESREGVSN
jgi:outer membrane protein TolC